MNHIENAGRLATFFGLQMYVPFVLNDVRTISEQLPFKLQARKGSYKAVLRKLSCQYFDPAYVYAKKHGFPTPTENWMNGPLSQRVTESRMGKGAGSRYYSAEGLSSLSIDTGLPHYWYTICLDELLSQAEALVDCHYAP
jgi:hypothetical protein